MPDKFKKETELQELPLPINIAFKLRSVVEEARFHDFYDHAGSPIYSSTNRLIQYTL